MKMQSDIKTSMKNTELTSNKASEIYKKMITIQKSCSLVENNTLADEITWSSSGSSELFPDVNKANQKKRSLFSVSKTLQFDARHKVEEWIKATECARNHEGNNYNVRDVKRFKASGRLDSDDRKEKSKQDHVNASPQCLSPIIKSTQNIATSISRRLLFNDRVELHTEDLFHISSENDRVVMNTVLFIKNNSPVSPILKSKISKAQKKYINEEQTKKPSYDSHKFKMKTENDSTFENSFEFSPCKETSNDRLNTSPVLIFKTRKNEMAIKENTLKENHDNRIIDAEDSSIITSKLNDNAYFNTEAFKGEPLSQISIHCSLSSTAGPDYQKQPSIFSDAGINIISSITQKEEIQSSFSISSLQATPNKKSSTQSIISTSLTNSFEKTGDNTLQTLYIKDEFDSTLKRRKKKFTVGGLASRLQKILKKQKSSLSVWRHENFLAANSNFEIPAVKGNVLRLSVLYAKEEYGKTLIRCEKQIVCDTSEYYTLVINSYYIDSLCVSTGCEIKIYMPYKIIRVGEDLDLGCCEYFIINVCKIETDV